MRHIDQHWLVRADIEEAYRWYEQQQPGLGRRFNTEVRAVLRRLCADSLDFAVRFADIRRANLPSFPYGVFYFLTEDAVVVIGVLHGARDSQEELERRRNRNR